MRSEVNIGSKIKEISNEYELLDRSYILNHYIVVYIVAHEMTEHDDIEPCPVEESQQKQISLNENKQSRIIILFDKWTCIWFGSDNPLSVKPVGHREIMCIRSVMRIIKS